MMKPPKDVPHSWINEGEEVLFRSKVVDFLKRTCRSADGEKRHDFYLLRSSDWCNIIPVTEDGKVVFVKQFRAGVEDFTLEVPGGLVDPGESPREAALRELTEETGYSALPGARCIDLNWTFPNPALQNNRVYGFAVGPVKRTAIQHLDEGEMIEVIEVPIAEVPSYILNGQITHALMLNTFLMLTLRNAGGSGGLAQELQSFLTAQSPVKD